MKKKLFLMLNFLAMVIIASAQAPNAIPYQGVARNAAGNILASQPISLRVSIHDISAGGTVVFSETHSITTTSLGLFNVNIGAGTPVSGTLGSVDWGNGAKFMQVELDPNGGSSYTDMGTTQLNSVPYALYAGNANSSGQWTTTGNDISNSNIGNVGIGTNTPASKLTVVKSNGNSLELLSGSNFDWTSLAIGRSAEEMNLGVAVGPGNFMNGTQEGDAVIRVNDNTKKIVISPWVDNPTMVVTGTTVGIANTTPSSHYALDVNPAVDGPYKSSARFTGDVVLDGSNSTFGTGWLGFRNSTNSTEWDVEGGPDRFTIGRSGIGYDLSIAGNGNVGIGTTTPSANLDVASQGSTGYAGQVRLNAPNLQPGSQTVFINGKDNSQSNQAEWRFEYDGPSSALNAHAFGFSNIQPFVFFTAGERVGIGTGAPDAKLDVEGTVKIADGTQGTGKVLTSDANGIASWQTAAASAWTAFGNDISNINSGNVGIGTATPGSKLTIVKPLGNSLELLSGSSTDWTALAIGRAAEEMNVGVAMAPDNFMNGTQAGDAVIRVNDNTKKIVISPWVANPTMVVTGTAVGIGNTSPSSHYSLDVNATTDGPYKSSAKFAGDVLLDGSNSTFGSGWLGFRNTTNGTEWDVEGGANYFTIGRAGVGYDVSIASNGNVGIGTGNASVPGAKLEVAGNVKIADGTQGAGKILISDANGVASWSNTAPLLKTVNTNLNPSNFTITNENNNQLIYDNHSWTIATDLAAGFTCDGVTYSNFSGTISCASAILYEKNSNTAVSSIVMPSGAHIRIQAVDATHVFVTVY